MTSGGNDFNIFFLIINWPNFVHFMILRKHRNEPKPL